MCIRDSVYFHAQRIHELLNDESVLMSFDIAERISWHIQSLKDDFGERFTAYMKTVITDRVSEDVKLLDSLLDREDKLEAKRAREHNGTEEVTA